MKERERIKVLLISREQAVFRFFSNLFSGEPLELLRCVKPEDAERTTAALKPAVILFHVDNQDDLPLLLLSRILIKHSVPTLLVSRAPGAVPDIISRGLKMGAVDILAIPDRPGDIPPQQGKRITRSVKSCSAVKMPPLSYKDIVSVLHEPSGYPADGAAVPAPGQDGPAGSRIELLGLAISTGGPSALSRFIPSLPEAFPPPVLVVQHIIPGFISSVAARLNSSCAIKVKIAEDGEPLTGGSVYFAPDGRHLKAARVKGVLTALLDEKPAGTLFRPSADVMFDSLVDCCGSRCMGVIMTGMGKDGVEGLRSIKNAGGITIAQDRQSSAIYGMARIAVDEKLIDHVVPLNRMAEEIYRIIIQ